VTKEDIHEQTTIATLGTVEKLQTKKAGGGRKQTRGRSGEADAVADYGDCKKRNTDTDAEEALHRRRVDECKID
jgi:hypothetical protein